jgi:quercetin dioxygenase-like cupin family protein
MSDSAIQRTVLLRHPIADRPGWEVRMVLLEYPPGAAAPRHHHPVEGYGYVLSGAVESAFGDDAPRTFVAGEAFVDDAKRVHTISHNADPAAPLRMLVTYVIPSDQPNVVP